MSETGQDGPVLGEDARRHALIAVGVNGGSSSAAVRLREEIDTEKVDLVLAAIAPHVAAAEQWGAERAIERATAMLEKAWVWADPMGRWTADQADAARAQKAEMIRLLRSGR